jgi:N-acetylglucosamine malate deacetylase 1
MNILAVGCHPDDLEIGCAGTLARCVARGDTVFMCIVANGNLGHVEIMPDELRLVRRAEALAGAKQIGAAQTFLLDVGDLEVYADHPETVQKMVAVIRQVTPDLIITHGPTDYMRDHVEVGKLVFDASFSASVPHYLPESGPAAGLTPLYYMDNVAGVNFLPAEYVDISTTIETKLAALDCHVSQIKWLKDHDGIDFRDFVQTVAKFRGLQCGAPYAEGFTACPVWPRLTTRRLLP